MNRFVFDGKQQVRLEPFTLEDLKPGEVRVKSLYSLMSTGTENIVFNRLFEPGSHWDKWVRYPFYPGYAVVGEVEKLGPDVKTVKVGDRVAIRASHRSHHNVGEGAVSLIPEGIPLPEAVWFAFAKIAFMGAKAAEFIIGDTSLLIGAGPIGQMAIRWARALGVQRIQVA
ncbi:MAG: alcohol dehydrogenase catalytic domain-containing protein, partial [Spirochaetia bacterium]|nr:alcohol dehydrogenase catalytic domain-containing protein [Spirochaetia bacterium]